MGDIRNLVEKIEQDANTLFENKTEEVEEVEGEITEVERLTFEEFTEAFRKSPALFLEKSLSKMVADKLKVEAQDVEECRLIPAIAYVPYWYLAPYLGEKEGLNLIPEPFRPLLVSVAILSTKIVKGRVRSEVKSTSG